jgi:hypothetical protein
MKIGAHAKHDGSDPACAICRCLIDINRVFEDTMPSTPRYRYWRIKRRPGKSERTFEYTTETADGGKYWAIERRWVRVKNGERGKIIRKVGFKTRTKAKARAHEWYTKAQSPAPAIA